MALPPGPLVRDTAAEALAAVVDAGGADDVPAPLVFDAGRHLRGRFGFGATLADTTAATSPDPDAWWADQVRLGQTSPGYSGVPGLTAALPSLGLGPQQTRDWLLQEFGTVSNRAAGVAVGRATLALQAWSPAQLYEAVVDLLGNTVYLADLAAGPLLVTFPSYDAQVIRPNAFGKFSDLLIASARHPAMMDYLDNAVAGRYSPNENYGRELLERHTVGAASGYTQNDVVNSARAMTGRRVDRTTYEFSYVAAEHWMGPLKIMGFRNANNDPTKGLAMGDKYLTYLATHPATAARVARAMCVRFVSDTPSDDLVAAVAAAYTANGTAILPALSVIVRSTEFWASRGAKLRRPTESVVGAVRALGLTPRDLAAAGDRLFQSTLSMGVRPWGRISPDGWADVATAWTSAGGLVEQWRLQRAFANTAYKDSMVGPDLTALWGDPAPATVGAALDVLSARVTGVVATGADKQALLDVLQEVPDRALSKSRLLKTSGTVVALMLHSPHHALR